MNVFRSLSLCPCHLGCHSSCPLAQYQQLKIAELACVSIEPQFRTSFFVLFISFFFLFSFLSHPLRSFFFFSNGHLFTNFSWGEKKSWLTEDETSSRGNGGKGRHENTHSTERNRGIKSATVRPWHQLSTLIVNDSVGRFLTLKAAFVIKLLTQPLENKKRKKENNKMLT